MNWIFRNELQKLNYLLLYKWETSHFPFSASQWPTRQQLFFFLLLQFFCLYFGLFFFSFLISSCLHSLAKLAGVDYISAEGWLVGWVLWHINFVGYLMPNPFLCKLSVLFQTIQFRKSTQFNCQKHFYFKLFSLVK